ATHQVFETYQNVEQEIRNQLNAKAEAVQIIPTGIDNDIYSTVDACPNAYEMWKAIKRLKQVNEIQTEKIARVANPLALVAQQQQVNHHQTHPTHFNQNSSTRTHQSATRKREKAVVNSPQPIYDQEPSMVDDDDEDTHQGKAVVNSPQPIYDQEPSMVDDDDEDTSKEKKIDRLMALISLSFKKIYKPTNNKLRTSSNTSGANQDNYPRIHRNAGYEGQRSGTVAGARDTVEAEYVSLSAYCAQVLWMRTQLTDCGFHFDKIPMYCDSKAAIAISCNPVQHSR
nr:uncharacterized mitochondrial protein AtMg00810-like [Tanacetum cinerariifolium]